METKINEWMNKLAAQLFSGKTLESFNALPLKDRVSGMAILAHIGGDVAVKNACMSALKTMQAVR